MKNETAIRDILLRNTIHLIAEGGFEMATTKAIALRKAENAPEIRMNEVYIYRLYGGKTQLYGEAFGRLDRMLVSALRTQFDVIGDFSTDIKDRLYEIFNSAWRFVLANEDNCRCYIRYYYSVYFKDNSRANHNKLFAEVIAKFKPLFKEEADVTSIMHSVFTTMLDFAIRVYNGDLEDTESNRKHVFNVLYCAMATYFKDEIKLKTHIPSL